jgi:hypothetical protein
VLATLPHPTIIVPAAIVYKNNVDATVGQHALREFIP